MIVSALLFGVSACSGDSPSSTTTTDDTTEDEIDTPSDDVTTSDTEMADSDFVNAIKIVYSGTSATVTGSVNGVTTTTDGAVVSITSTASNVNYQVTGTTTNGGLEISSTQPLMITFNGASLTRTASAPVAVTSAVVAYIKSLSGSTSKLTDSSSNTLGATLYSKGTLNFIGTGTLVVEGLATDAIQAAGDVTLKETNLSIPSAVEDGIQAKGAFSMTDGTLTLISSTQDAKGVKASGDINLSGGTVNMSVTGDQSKGFKSGTTTNISGGTIKVITSGNVVLEEASSGYDPSYCTAFKSDTDVNISGGTITITSSGTAGKGISPDGNFTMTGGTLTINTSGNGGKYTDESGALDSYSATGISPDGNCYLYGGTIYVKSTGTAGKGISSDGDLVIGQSTSTTGPTVEVHTTGAKFLVSGSGNSADYANPKAIKSDANVTINSGTITINATQDGGEGLESEATMTIKGGTLYVTTVDDCLNATTAINISGGKLYCYASGNDGMDSNGTISISGGVVIASGAAAPEAGIDADNSQFAITGGTVIGLGGSTSSPTASATTQRVVVYRGLSLTSGQILAITNSSGSAILTFKMPRTYSSATLLFSNADLTTGSYTVYKGGSVTNPTSDFNGLYTGGTYTTGTSAGTFTVSSMVTTVGTGR